MRGACCRFLDAELQQRAVEYLGLERRPDVAKRNVAGMPPWEKRKSLLLRRMAEKEVSWPVVHESAMLPKAAAKSGQLTWPRGKQQESLPASVAR